MCTYLSLLTVRQKAIMRCSTFSLFCGSVSIVIGVLALTVLPIVIENGVVELHWLGNLPTTSNETDVPNEITRMWIDPAYNMTLRIWIYTVLNEYEIVRGEKPSVQQIGPFTFIELQNKTVEFAKNNIRVFYKNSRRYIFNQTLSCSSCNLRDTITIPNLIVQKLNDLAENSTATRIAINSILKLMKRETPFITTTVGEALFDGYTDQLIHTVCDHKLIRPYCQKQQIPERIGFLYGRNNTDDGVYEISTGQTNRSDIGTVYSWNNLTALPETYWSDPSAREIVGTDGQLFSPLLKEGQDLTIFNGLLCRSITFDYARESTYDGISTFRYKLGSHVFDPMVLKNRPFCNPTTPTFFTNATVQIPGCLPAGFLDISRCLPGEPRIYISHAHFRNAPIEISNSLEGIAPENHHGDETYFDIEPMTSVIINAKQRLQINVGMKGGSKRGLSILSKMRPIILPIFWMNETATFDPLTKDMLHTLMTTRISIKYFGIVFVSMGVICWIAFAVKVAVSQIVEHAHSTTEEEQSIISSDSDRDDSDTEIIRPVPVVQVEQHRTPHSSPTLTHTHAPPLSM